MSEEQCSELPFEVVLEAARRFVESASVMELEEASGIPRSTLYGLLSDGNRPHPRIRRLLTLWHLRATAAAADPALDVARRYAARCAGHLGHGPLAQALGITRPRLEALLAGEPLSGDAAEALLRWYTGEMTGMPGRVRFALDALCGMVDVQHRSSTERALLEGLRSIHIRTGAPLPPWLNPG